MNQITTEVLVIGGGATGTGVVRDLAMRGFQTVLVESRDFSHGTTGRHHGLLHSGGRYAVKDPGAAKECISENRILRHIMPFCLEDTGGFFVVTPWDPPDFSQLFWNSCKQCGIPIEELPVSQMLKQEPLLNPKISRCFKVPDASADPFLASHANIESAREYKSIVLNYHHVEKLRVENDRIVGAVCVNQVNGEQVVIHADIVVNAAGAWCGKIAELAGIEVKMLPGKGVMIAANQRIVNTVINRCKMPSDGDILVPVHTIAIIGTTDIKVEDPDHSGIEPWEVELLMNEGEKIIPGFKEMRMLRSWVGVRPLYQENKTTQNRDITRAMVLLDHKTRDGIAGIITITSGKWTTYRKMAEETANLVCKKLNTNRPCRTHLEPLPGPKSKQFHTLGSRLREIEQNKSYGELVCECELATVADVISSIEQGHALTLDDIRRDIRLGMGPCQGGFCSMRAIGLIHKHKHPPVESINASLRDFLQERWKGILPILWDQQLRQERLNELIYRSLLDVDHLPGPSQTHLKSDSYVLYQPVQEKWLENCPDTKSSSQLPEDRLTSRTHKCDCLIIGAGLAGLVAGWQSSLKGEKVKILAKGWGATHTHTGCIDILGYRPETYNEIINNPKDGIKTLINQNSGHPYSKCGIVILDKAIDELKKLSLKAGYPLHGQLEYNWLLPSSLGAVRPTCLAPQTMIAGDLREKSPMLIIGFEGYQDFYAELIAYNLQAQGFDASGANLESDTIKNLSFVNNRTLANLFESKQFRLEIINLIKSYISKGSINIQRIGFPAVLGFENALDILKELEDSLGVKIFEIPTLPPSIPGQRIQRILTQTIENNGGQVLTGIEVVSATVEENKITGIYSKTATRYQKHQSDKYILATGGILGGGFTFYYEDKPRETIFDIPLDLSSTQTKILDENFLSYQGHPIYRCGILVNGNFQANDRNGNVPFQNLHVAGNLLAHCDPILERSFEGVSLLSGYISGKNGN